MAAEQDLERKLFDDHGSLIDTVDVWRVLRVEPDGKFWVLWRTPYFNANGGNPRAVVVLLHRVKPDRLLGITVGIRGRLFNEFIQLRPAESRRFATRTAHLHLLIHRITPAYPP